MLISFFLIDAKERYIGNLNKEVASQLLKTLAIYPLTKRLGMSIEQVNELVARAQSDAANLSLRPYFPL